MEDCGISHGEEMSALHFFDRLGDIIYGSKGECFSYTIPIAVAIRNSNKTIPATTNVEFFFSLRKFEDSMVCELGTIEGQTFIAAGKNRSSECYVEVLVPISYQKNRKKGPPVRIRLYIESLSSMDGRHIDAVFTEWITLQPKANQRNKRSFDHIPGSDQGGGKLANVGLGSLGLAQPPPIVCRAKKVDVTASDFRKYSFGNVEHLKDSSELPYTFPLDNQEGIIRMDLIDAMFRHRTFQVPDEFLENLTARFKAEKSNVFALISPDYSEVFFLRIGRKEARICAKKFVVSINEDLLDEKKALKTRHDMIFRYLGIDPALQGDKSLRTATSTELQPTRQEIFTETIARPPLGLVDEQVEGLIEMIPNFGDDFLDSFLGLLDPITSASSTSSALTQSIDDFSADVFRDIDRQLMAEVSAQQNNELDQQQGYNAIELHGPDTLITPLNVPNVQDNEQIAEKAFDDFFDLDKNFDTET